MTKEKIARINELAKKSRTEAGLTEAEKAEQAALRREYIDEMKQSLRSQLDNADYIDDKGVRRPVSDLKKVKNSKSPYNHWSTGFCYAIIKR